MKIRQKTNWWLDLVLFAGFILSFFMNLTGVEIHQWIGTVSGLLAAVHLLVHIDWVEAVSKRFFKKTSSRARIFYVLDVLLLLGLILIGITGLVISTWLNFYLSSYTLWLTTHITVSITTLLTLMAKLILHSRWIVRTSSKILVMPISAPVENSGMQPGTTSSNTMGRREFMQVMGTIGAASLIALISASTSLVDTKASEAAPDTITTTALQSPSLSSSSSCTVRCHKSCSYPGHCHKYTDLNNNSRCDLGECA